MSSKWNNKQKRIEKRERGSRVTNMRTGWGDLPKGGKKGCCPDVSEIMGARDGSESSSEERDALKLCTPRKIRGIPGFPLPHRKKTKK